MKKKVSLRTVLLSLLLLNIGTIIIVLTQMQARYSHFFTSITDSFEPVMTIVQIHTHLNQMDDLIAAMVTTKENQDKNIQSFQKHYTEVDLKLNRMESSLKGSSRYYAVDTHNMFRTYQERELLFVNDIQNDQDPIYVRRERNDLKRLAGFIESELNDFIKYLLLQIQASYQSYYQQIGSFRISVIFAIAIGSLVLTVLSWLMMTIFLNAISDLIGRMNEFIATHQYQPPVKNRSFFQIAEIEKLKSNYDLLIREITKNMELEHELHQQKMNNLEMRNLLNRSELEMLQMQINPHFLFNTLNSINALAQIEDAPKVCDMVTRLANLLRHSFQVNTQFSPLSDELSLVEDYIDIQNVRFNGNIDYHALIEPGLENHQIPNMIIQPLIENAIVHGFGSPKPGSAISLDVHRTEGGVEMIVQDNGKGIAPETISQIEKNSTEDHENDSHDAQHFNIGLSNVYRRFNLLYGSGHVKIESAEGQGTKIILNIMDSQIDLPESRAESSAAMA